MKFSEFTGEVQHRLDFGTQGETLRTIRATLVTLGERLQEGEATDLAGALPIDIDWYLEAAESGQRFDFDEFVSRVAEREGMDPDDDDDRSDVVFHAQTVVAVLAEVVPGSELDQVRAQLPDDKNWDTLFELVGTDEQADEE